MYVVQPAIEFDPATGVWVARHPELSIFSQGTSRREAREAILSAVRLVLKYHGVAANVTHAWKD